MACSEETQVRYHIGVAQCSNDAWRQKFNEEMRRELLFHPDVDLEIRSADDSNEQQAADVDYFISQHVDLLVVAPNEAEHMTPAVSRAFDAGIPVIVVDRRVNGEKYTAYIGGDNLEVGRLMGKYLMMQRPQGGKVLEVMGLPGSTPAELRHQGMMEALGDKATRYEWVQCMGAWFQEQAEQEAEHAMLEHPDIDIVMAQNDQMAMGARRAADRVMSGRNVIIMGVDGLTGPGNGVEAIEQGRIDASAVYSTSGDLVLRTAVSILTGQAYERNTLLPSYLIDIETAPLLNNIYKEVDHQVETVQLLKGQVDRYWQQHNLERTLLYCVLAFLLLAFIFVIVLYRNYNVKQKLNESLARQKETLREQRDQLIEQRNQLEQQNTQLQELTRQVEEATKAKLMFFTNVSHDFRTPLTLIAGPLEQMQHMLAGEPTAMQTGQLNALLNLARKNVQVLLRLVNQILDFRKYESGKLELNLQPVDMREAVSSWTEAFQSLAHKKHIRLSLQDSGAQCLTMSDLPKLERIYFNLMGNAFKFTPENGHITVSLDTTDKDITLRIADTGPGISVEHIQHIFENFYQVDSAHHEGSGIGLALVKNFVELHNGQITVANQEEGTGTIFTVTLPIVAVPEGTRVEDINAVRQQAIITSSQIETELGDVLEPDDISEDEQKPVVLVIDDNSDIRQYLRALLGQQYCVLTAADGQEGIRKAMRTVPDVIVCDVMMPGMDGIECCRRLKAEVNTCHVPVMMLTACSLDEQRVEGLADGGADAYMAKPFNVEVFSAQIASLISNHNRVRDFFAQDITGARSVVTTASGLADGAGMAGTAGAPAESRVTVSLDDKFLQKLRQLIDKNMGDSDLSVEQLGDAMGMSRAQLYRKCKALTNYSPVELIRNTRLKRAQQLLAQGDDTIAQVAYTVGFTAPSYFSKCYKDYFGEMPTELVKRKG